MKEQVFSKGKDFLLDILYDVASSIMMAISINVFTAPNGIAPGGISGIAIIINHFTGLPIGTLNLAMNITLLLIGYKVLGRRFTFNTLKTIAIGTVFLDVILVNLPTYTSNPLLGALFGGVCLGASLGLVFLRGSTTGGLDIVTRLVQKKRPHLSMGRVMLILDFCVLGASMAAFGSIEVGLYGLISIFVTSQVVDAILYGADVGKLALIISDKSDEIARAVMSQLDRGATLLKGVGAYSSEEKHVLMCALRKQEFYRLKKLTYEIDPKAFLIVTEAGEVAGEGFKSLEG